MTAIFIDKDGNERPLEAFDMTFTSAPIKIDSAPAEHLLQLLDMVTPPAELTKNLDDGTTTHTFSFAFPRTEHSIRLRVDPKMPPGEIRFYNGDKEVGLITSIGNGDE